MERKVVRSEAIESISERLSALEDLYFPRALQSTIIDPSQRKAILLDLLSRDAAVFLERYGSKLTCDELREFDALKDDYEISWHVKHLRSLLSPTSDELKSRAVQVKNRRRAYLNKLIFDGHYFSEDSMREREPYLHHEYVGKFQDPSGRSMARPGERWSDTLLRRSEEAILVAKIRGEQQRLGIAESDWVGGERNQQVEEQEEEEEEEEEEDPEEEEVENKGGDIESNAKKSADGDEDMKVADAEEEEDKKKHAELLSLPQHGSEVYLGGIPHDASEEDLRGFCGSIGEVTEVRIMKGKDSGEAKGYAFVTFRNKELASKAIEELNNSQLKGKKIKCSTSQAKHRLFIGNVPRIWGEEDMKKAVTDIGPGVISVELLKDPQNSSRNRGFAFIEYYNHACADYSRQKMSTSKFKLDTNAPTVSWADPKNAESSASSQVKAVYVKNLPKDITQDDLKELFDHHGKITKVVLPPAKAGQEKSRFGFVHFAERASAMKALKNTEKYEIGGQVLECSLAKPQADQKSSGASNHQKSAPLPTYPPRLGYGMVGGGPYGGLGAGYGGGAGFAQPLIYGRGPTPAGMAMMPMLLPDGRIGYVLQQPGVQPHAPPPQSRGGRSGGSSSGGRRSNDSNRGRSRYNPY